MDHTEFAVIFLFAVIAQLQKQVWVCAHNARGHGIGCQAIHTSYMWHIFDLFWENVPKRTDKIF